MRVVPVVGMEVRVIDLGHTAHGLIDEVADDGRTVVVAGERYVLHTLTGQWVREGDPYYGRRLRLGPAQP